MSKEVSKQQTTLQFESLPPYRPRSFLPTEADLTDVETVTDLYQKLLGRHVQEAGELERWLLDRSELAAAITQTHWILYIRMTCQTDDEQRAAAYKKFVETVEPAVRTLSDRMDRKYLADRENIELDADRYFVYDRGIRNAVELFRDENVPLQTEVSLLSQEYQAVTGGMNVEFMGQERTMPQMNKFLTEPDRPLRESAWRAASERRLAEKDKLAELFDKMFAVRSKIAANAGCADFREYQFKAFGRFDYTPAECIAYHDAVEATVTPLCREIYRERQRRMGLESLRPWDTAVDPAGRPPLKPFVKAEELISGAKRIFAQLDPELGEQFAGMDAQGLLDLASRKGKAPGGYETSLSEARRPFIFMNAVGLDRDVRVLLHEGGHAFHSLACVDEPLMTYRHAPMEFNEVASMSMELLAGEHLGVFYESKDLARSRREQLEGIVYTLGWIATIDAFQHWIYTHPSHSRDERRAAWIEIYDRFSPELDWAGLDEAKGYMWHRQLHVFLFPFYYIEYGIAQLGALQLWARARTDPAEALAGYRKALALGGSRRLPELFDAAGIRFNFSAETIGPLMEMVCQELQALPTG